ncbi:DUF6491 family protein [Brevundimonas sp.]|uniref:DUF6491 family protein n=1 Tax=Brevundimonas sp. TaxID=1871086 RepID=UPI002FCB159C
MNLKPASALAVVALVSACAPVAGNGSQANMDGTSPRQCFNSYQVRGFTAPKRDTIHLQVDGNRTFELEAFGVCNDLDDAFGIAFLPDLGMSRVCTGDTARILTRGGVEPATPCRVRVVKRVVVDPAAKPASGSAETRPAA